MGLPNWQTTLTEDVILLGSTVFLILRWADDSRKTWSESHAQIINAGFVILIYSILWLGFVRGYYVEYGKLTALFPLCLIVALFIDPYPKQEQSQIQNQIGKALIILNILVFFMLLLWGRMAHREANMYYQISKYILSPSLVAVPILSLAFLHAKRFPALNNSVSHIPVLIPIVAMMLTAWSGNAYTWALWYTAGKLEREWTPYQYDKTSQPELYAAAERKPLDAVKFYALVKQRLQSKGDIPQYWNWDFLMQYRMAYQARRLNNASKCLTWLPPESAKTQSQIQMLQDLWDIEFITGMMHNTDMFNSDKSFFIDLELGLGASTKQDSYAYAMDIFGKVYEYNGNQLHFVWKPNELITNAVDLEVISKNNFAVLTTDGKVFLSDPAFKYLMYDEYVKDIQTQLPLGQKAVDMEWLTFGAVILTDHGLLIFEGKIPNTVPREQRFDFGKSVASDLEISSNQNEIYVLDVYGGIHSSVNEGEPSYPHQSPPIDESLIPYWLNQNVAIDLELDRHKRGIYVYNKMGEVFSVTTNPFRETYRPSEQAPFRGKALMATEWGINRDEMGTLYALESNGNIIKIP